MRRLSLILPALVILCGPFSAAAQENFPSADAFLKSILQGEDQLSIKATGDLNGDGLADWAGVIHRQKPDASPTYQLYVLLGVRGGGYRVAEKSLEEEIAGMGCCWVENLEIKRSSIYIQNNAKTCCTMEAATHQFKLHRGAWRLVGVRIYYIVNDPEASSMTDTDMNLLTGAVVEKYERDGARPHTKRRRKKFPAYFLRDYDFSNGFGIE